MAGFRQGLAPVAPEGPKRSGGRCRPGFLVPRGMGEAQGKKLWTAPLQLGGKRRSRPLPTRAIDEDVGECGLPIVPRRFGEGRTCVQCPAHRLWPIWRAGFAERECSPIADAGGQHGIAPTHRVSMDRAKRGRLGKGRSKCRDLFRANRIARRADLCQPVARNAGRPFIGSGRSPHRTATDHAPIPRPGLPDGALL